MRFLEAMQSIKVAHRTVEELEPGLVGYQLREVIAARVSLRRAEERLVALAKLRGQESKQDAA